MGPLFFTMLGHQFFPMDGELKFSKSIIEKISPVLDKDMQIPLSPLLKESRFGCLVQIVEKRSETNEKWKFFFFFFLSYNRFCSQISSVLHILNLEKTIKWKILKLIHKHFITIIRAMLGKKVCPKSKAGLSMANDLG